MIDALLREHARKGAEDDDAFLQSLEERLDEEDKVISMSSIEHHGADRANKLSRALGLGLKVAAGLTVAAVGFYGWQQSLQKERLRLPLMKLKIRLSAGQQERWRPEKCSKK